MSLFGFGSGGKTLKFDQREVKIIYHVVLDSVKIDKLEHAIKEVFGKLDIAHNFPWIEIIVDNDERDHIAGGVTMTADIKSMTVSYEPVIHINARKIEDTNCTMVLAHELAHLWDAYSTRVRQDDSINQVKVPFILRNKYSTYYEDIRDFLHIFDNFKALLRIEGLARFVENYCVGKAPSDYHVARSLYDNSASLARQILSKWDAYHKKRKEMAQQIWWSSGVEWNNNFKAEWEELQKLIYTSSYDIGFHMFYTIYYNKKIPINEIIKLKPDKFIQAYEEALHKFDGETGEKLVPVVSMHGNGIIDYVTVVKQWKAIMKEFKEESEKKTAQIIKREEELRRDSEYETPF